MQDIKLEELLKQPEKYVLSQKLEKTDFGKNILVLLANAEFKKINSIEQEKYIINVYKGNEFILPPMGLPPINPIELPTKDKLYKDKKIK